MAKWIRKAEQTITSLRVNIPKVLVDELGWQKIKYVTVQMFLKQGIIIERLPDETYQSGSDTKNNAGGD